MVAPRECQFTLSKFSLLHPYFTLSNNLREGVMLPRPRDAPHNFQRTRSSLRMWEIIKDWVQTGLLIQEDCADVFPLFLLGMRNKGIRIIHDFSNWTEYINAPYFSLVSAGAALREILEGHFLIKTDLRSGFYHIPLTPDSKRFAGVYYAGTKYCFTRLPMGNALEPYKLQSIMKEVLAAIEDWLPNVKGIAYLDDLLFHAYDPETLKEIPKILEEVSLTLNYENFELTPSRRIGNGNKTAHDHGGSLTESTTPVQASAKSFDQEQEQNCGLPQLARI
uniref:(California timema) hypothetical protein n=1 Tax=Timema californicum TaxID=61474 RepID=A0A7R9J991_TIMCA|nr:unnamed protein product [Timema californicum]